MWNFLFNVNLRCFPSLNRQTIISLLKKSQVSTSFPLKCLSYHFCFSFFFRISSSIDFHCHIKKPYEYLSCLTWMKIAFARWINLFAISRTLCTLSFHYIFFCCFILHFLINENRIINGYGVSKLNEFYFIIFLLLCTSFHLKYKMAFWLPFSATIYYFSCIFISEKKFNVSIGNATTQLHKKNQFFIYTHAILNYDVLKNRLKKNKIFFVVFFEFNKKKR